MFDSRKVGTTGDYRCLDRTYDLSNHSHGGVDYFLWPFPSKARVSDQIDIVAAELGTIVDKFDGSSDRSCPNNYSTDWQHQVPLQSIMLTARRADYSALQTWALTSANNDIASWRCWSCSPTERGA